jgi:hypothetical protein
MHLSTRRTSDIDKIAPVREFYGSNVYVRECFIPRGTAFIGRIHMAAHVVIMPYGDIIVWNNGERLQRKGYQVFESKEGTQRIGLAIQDTLWLTAHHLESLNEDPVETLTAATAQEYLSRANIISDDIGSITTMDPMLIGVLRQITRYGVGVANSLKAVPESLQVPRGAQGELAVSGELRP